MRPLGVLLDFRILHDPSGLRRREEPKRVQTLIAELPIEALDVPFPFGLPDRINERYTFA